jgi:hypothetical protein
MRTASKLVTLGAAMTVLAVGAAPLLTSAADHLDAPALGHTVANGAIDLVSSHGDRDINDLYVFKAPDNANRTAIALTTNPAIDLFGGDFGTNVRYAINVDTNGDNVQDIAYVATFADDGSANLKFKLSEYDGSRAVSLSGGRTIAQGHANDGTKAVGGNGVWAWSGVRSDPFFFDLLGFIGTTTLLKTGTAVGDDRLGVDPSDFFLHRNTNAIVLSIPSSTFPNRIGVWATTSYSDASGWHKADQMGRPAINTVFNPAADKDDFNRTAPSQQTTAFGGKFVTNVEHGLQFFSSLDSEGSYTDAQAAFLASILIPDVLVYDRTSTLPAPLNGRALADDVIDTELRVTSGGDPLNLFGADGATGLLPNRDASGGVNGDGVGAHTDYLGTFPYLGVPH